MHPFEHLTSLVEEMSSTRPVLRRGFANTTRKLTDCYHEVKEASDASVLPHGEKRTRELAHELADILINLLTIANVEGLDLLGAGIEKMERNQVKYAFELLQEGDYETQVALVRKVWEEKGGDEAYFKDKH